MNKLSFLILTATLTLTSCRKNKSRTEPPVFSPTVRLPRFPENNDPRASWIDSLENIQTVDEKFDYIAPAELGAWLATSRSKGAVDFYLTPARGQNLENSEARGFLAALLELLVQGRSPKLFVPNLELNFAPIPTPNPRLLSSSRLDVVHSYKDPLLAGACGYLRSWIIAQQFLRLAENPVPNTVLNLECHIDLSGPRAQGPSIILTHLAMPLVTTWDGTFPVDSVDDLVDSSILSRLKQKTQVIHETNH